jgi:hypothetical protein
MRPGIGAECRHVGKGDACRTGRFRDRPCTEIVHRAELLLAAFEQQPDKVDHVVATGNRTVYRSAITQICLNGLDLADAAKRLQMESQIGMANGNANAVAPLGQRTHDMTTDKAGASENGDEFWLNDCHRALLKCKRATGAV